MRYLFRKKSLRVAAACLDATGIFWKIFAPRKRLQKSQQNFLLVRLDHLGDILFTTGIPQLLKENDASCGVSFLTSSAGAALLENNSFVDEVIVYDAPWFSRNGKKGALRWNAILRRIKEGNFDTALCFRGDIRENWLVTLAGIQERIGFGVTGGGALLSQCLPYRHGVHEREHSLDILKAVGVDVTAIRPQISFTPEEEVLFSEKARSRGLSQTRFIGVQLDCGTEAKQWPAANIEIFLDLLSNHFSQRPVVFVGSDLDLGKRLDGFLKERPSLKWTNLVGRSPLRELFWIAKQCRIFVGHDSGPTHVAASFGVPTLFLYSGTNRWEEWCSLEENADFLRKSVACSPCHLTKCGVAGHPCMAGIEPEKVVRWMEEKARVDV